MRDRGTEGTSGADRTDGSAGGRTGREPASARAAPTPDPAEELRGRLFSGLDRLAFALELEAARALRAGDEAEAMRIEDRRLGVRLAQRHVSGVHAAEIDPRIEATRAEYDRRTGRSDRAAGPITP